MYWAQDGAQKRFDLQHLDLADLEIYVGVLFA